MLKGRRIFLFIRKIFYFVFFLSFAACSTPGSVSVPDLEIQPEGEVIFSFGIVADCQFSNESGNWFMNRYYSRSAKKLRQSIKTFNTVNAKFVIDLGDLIDRDFKSFDATLTIYNSMKMPRYQTLGNHDFSVADDKKPVVPSRLGMKHRYYDFAFNGWRFVVLDGNDLSFHAWPNNSLRFKESLSYYKKNGISSPDWNGAVGPEQLSWLRKILSKSAGKKEKVMIFCHFPVLPAGNDHNLWNAAEVVTVIESYACVKAYVNGHDHRGGYARRKGIHYLTLPGMVETKNRTSFAVVNMYKNVMVIDGTGRCPDMVLAY